MKPKPYHGKALLLLVIFLSASGCYRKFYPVDFRMELERVTAADLEEDGYWVSSMDDEVHIRYALAALNSENKVVAGPYGRHYGPVEFTYKGDYHTGFEPLGVHVPARGKIYFAVQLEEDDDYSYYSSIIDDLSTIFDVAQFFTKNKKTGKLASRTLKRVSRVLFWADIAITVIDIIDSNDQLMAFCMILDEEQLEALAQTYGGVEGGHRSTGSNWGDYFDYRINFSLMAEHASGEIVKERIKSKAPNVIVDISPFQIDQTLNDFWDRSPDRLLVESGNNSDDYDFSDGLYNKSFSASLGVPIAPAFWMGKKSSSLGKFYLQGGYRRLPYLLNFDNDIKIGSHYLENNSGMPSDFTVNSLELDLHQYRGAALFKLIGRSVSWDLGGGLLYHEGKTRFNGIEIGNPDAQFIYDEDQNVIKKDFMPYAFTKFGIGKINRNKGFQVNFGAAAFKPEFRANDQFQLFTDPGNGSLEPATISSSDWRFNFSFGLSFFL